MNIRAKFTITFFSMVIIVLTIVSLAIYFFSANYRKEDFFRRLKNRAINTSKILRDIEEVDAELLKRMERNNPARLPNQYIIIYNYKNEILYKSDEAGVIPVDTILLNKIRLKKEIRYKYKNFEVLGFLFTDKYDRFTVVAAATDVYGLNGLQNLSKILIITFCVSIVFVSILGWVYAGRVLNPISKIVNEVSNITEANLSQRLGEGNQRDELSKLARTFNSMLERLQSAFYAQKNFIANASHEIKTPITVMSGEIEVTLLQERNKNYYINALRSVLSGLKGLNKLSSQLLLLAQTSADQPEKNFALIRIDDILWEIKEELLKAHPDYNIDILFDLNLNHESLLVNGDEQLVKIAISNLADNGCKYSYDNHVTINLNSNDSNYISIEFINKGFGIEPEHIDKVFQPFFREKNKHHVKGFGIGLSLVSRIVKLHDGQIIAESIPHQQTHFILKFPIRK